MLFISPDTKNREQLAAKFHWKENDLVAWGVLTEDFLPYFSVLSSDGPRVNVAGEVCRGDNRAFHSSNGGGPLCLFSI